MSRSSILGSRYTTVIPGVARPRSRLGRGQRISNHKICFGFGALIWFGTSFGPEKDELRRIEMRRDQLERAGMSREELR